MLAEIRTRVEELNARQAKLWADDLLPALAAEGVRIGTVADCSEAELAELSVRFRQEIYPVLTPLAAGLASLSPNLALSLSLGVFVRDAETGEERLARVKVPEGLPRFVEVGTRGLFLPLEDVIAHFLESLFPQMEIRECATFRRRGTPTSRSTTRRTTCSRRCSSNCTAGASATSCASR